MGKEPGAEGPGGRLASAYARMLDRMRAVLTRAEEDALPQLQQRIADAREKAVELEELTREEAERIGDYLRRDVVDAATYLSETGRELRDWLRFDLELVEERLLVAFSRMVDETRLELDRLAAEARANEELRAGEVTGLGTLRCVACGQEVDFAEPGQIEPCPACGGSRFRRVSA